MALSDVFDVTPTPIPEVVTEEQSIEPVVDDESIVDSDFTTARSNQKDLLTIGMASLNTAMKIASETENPRAIEVLSGLLKTVSDMNKQLIVLSKDREEVKTERTKRKQPLNNIPPVPQIGNQQNVFVSSSADLNKLLLAKIKEQEDGI